MVQDSIEVPYNIAAVYQAQGRYDEASKVLQDLLEKTEKTDNSYSQARKIIAPFSWSAWGRSIARSKTTPWL